MYVYLDIYVWNCIIQLSWNSITHFQKKYRIEIYIFYDVTHRIVGKVWEVEQPIKRCDADT